MTGLFVLVIIMPMYGGPLDATSRPGQFQAMAEHKNSFMEEALAEARAAAARDEVPVGAVLVHGTSHKILARAGNRCIELDDPTAHAEMLVLREGGAHLTDCDLYVTLEPCPMCAGALSLAHIRRLYFGAPDPKGGGVEHGPRVFDHPTCHHRPEVFGGLEESQAAVLLKEFFKERR
jgi:tRNA(adenine34) deaminase